MENDTQLFHCCHFRVLMGSNECHALNLACLDCSQYIFFFFLRWFVLCRDKQLTLMRYFFTGQTIPITSLFFFFNISVYTGKEDSERIFVNICVFCGSRLLDLLSDLDTMRAQMSTELFFHAYKEKQKNNNSQLA